MLEIHTSLQLTKSKKNYQTKEKRGGDTKLGTLHTLPLHTLHKLVFPKAFLGQTCAIDYNTSQSHINTHRRYMRPFCTCVAYAWRANHRKTTWSFMTFKSKMLWCRKGSEWSNTTSNIILAVMFAPVFLATGIEAYLFVARCSRLSELCHLPSLPFSDSRNNK